MIAEASELTAAVRLVRAHRPDVLVLDLRMPGGSSIETIGKLREQAPDTQIVVVTMEDSPVFAQRALDAGALGFVVKDLADEELPQAVRAAARGEEYVSPRLAARLEALLRAHRRRSDAARGRGPAADRARPHERRDRPQAAPLPAHRRDPPRSHPQQARARHPGRTGPLRARTRPAQPERPTSGRRP